MINVLQLLDYRAKCGTEAASNVLLLVGPDGFEGDYDKVMAQLEYDMRLEKLASRLNEVIKVLYPFDYAGTDGSLQQALDGLKKDPIGVIEYLAGLLEDMA